MDRPYCRPTDHGVTEKKYEKRVHRLEDCPVVSLRPFERICLDMVQSSFMCMLGCAFYTEAPRSL